MKAGSDARPDPKKTAAASDPLKPLVWLPLEGNLKDSAGTAILQAKGKINFVSDKQRGKVLELNGKSYLEGKRPASMNQLHKTLTVGFWFKPTKGRSHCEALLGLHESEVVLHRHGDQKVTAIHFTQKTDDPKKPQLPKAIPVSGADPDQIQWQHLAHVYDGQAIRVYHNGKKVAEGKVGAVEADKKLLMRVGNVISKRKAGPFRGRLDDLRIFDIPLSDKEIAQWVASTRAK